MHDSIVNAIRSMTQNWLRTVLTMSGIVVGVVSIVTLIAVLQGVKNEIRAQVESLGANFVMIVPGKLDDDGQINPGSLIGISSLTQKDVSALERVPGVADISPVSIVSGVVDHISGRLQRTASALVVATNRRGVEMNPTPIAEGRYFNDSERHVCILGYKPKELLFGNASAIGKTVRVQNIDWTVIGAMAKPAHEGTVAESMLGLSTLVYLPIGQVRRDIPGLQVNRIALRTDYNHPADTLFRSLRAAMLASHGNREDFGIITEQHGLSLVLRILSLAQSLLVLIAAISLFVAGIGIMNIMLVTVTERTREIGVRKTVGARQADIFLQFLTESALLSVAGGAIGLAVSGALCWVIGHYSELTPEITPGAMLLALLVCAFVGISFGVAPAMRAARLNPIDALRHE